MKNLYLFFFFIFTGILYSQNNNYDQLLEENNVLTQKNKILTEKFEELVKESGENLKSGIPASLGMSNKKFSGFKNNLIKIVDLSIDVNNSLECPVPRSLDDLDGGYDIFYCTRNYTLDVNGSAVYCSANVSNSKQELNYKFLQYKKGSCTINGVTNDILYGCGVDLELKVISKKKSLAITALPYLAAAVTYKDAQIEYKLKVIGVTGNSIRKNLSMSGTFDVENYAKIISSIDTIIDTMSDIGTKITPQVIVIGK
jgi:hypothetical protein